MAAKRKKAGLFDAWLEATSGTPPLYGERAGKQADGLKLVKELLAAHFVGEEVILKAGGYGKVANTIKNSMPLGKRTRSGDLGELLATEYIRDQTTFIVPFNKLQWKDDRKVAMRGNDVVAVRKERSTTKVLKAEVKSRANFYPSHVTEACESLDADDGRPNPATLAFITKRLYLLDRNEEAELYENLQTRDSIRAEDTEHLLFVFAGNDLTNAFLSIPSAAKRRISRKCAGIVVTGHSAFIEKVFK